MKKKLIVGTRGSALALVQAEMTEALLRNKFPELEVERKVITTTGDRRTDVSLAQVAKVEGVFDKGVFIKELEVALESGEVDLAVHSLKDMPTVLDDGFEVVATLERAPVADVLVTKTQGGIDSLPQGAKVASSSCRRQKMLRYLRPDIEMVDIRGNVPTRLRKLAENPNLDGILLAEAGLVRLGYDALGKMSTEAGDVFGQRVDPENFLPAAGQGAVALEIRSDDDETRKIAEALNHEETMTRITAEREFLRLLNGGCHTPVGVSTQIFGDQLMMEGIVFPEGEGIGEPMQAEVAGSITEPKLVAETLFKSLA